MSDTSTGKVRLTIHIGQDIKDWLNDESKQSGRTISDIVRRAIEHYSSAPVSVRRPTLKRTK